MRLQYFENLDVRKELGLSCVCALCGEEIQSACYLIHDLGRILNQFVCIKCYENAGDALEAVLIDKFNEAQKYRHWFKI